VAFRLKAQWLGLAVAALVLVGCSGVLMESKQPDGRLERVKIDAGESWEYYDDKPRYPLSHRKSYDEMSIMLKKQMTF
jgi:hypothetical protein